MSQIDDENLTLYSGESVVNTANLLLRHLNDVRRLETQMTQLEKAHTHLEAEVGVIKSQYQQLARLVTEVQEELERYSTSLNAKLDNVGTLLREHIAEINRQNLKVLWTLLTSLGSLVLIITFWFAKVFVAHAFPGAPIP